MLFQWGERRGEHVNLYMNREPNNWSAPGNVSGWDGNLDEPTLNPSIGVWNNDETAYVWHGFLRKGIMETI